MNDSENKVSEPSTERKEMKGPSFSFDPKLFLSNMNSGTSDASNNLMQKNRENTNNLEQKEENIPTQEKQPERELTAREKLRQKLQMKKMMRQNKGTLKHMLDSKIKS
mgnify:FL=1|jgi:hypothetical protein